MALPQNQFPNTVVSTTDTQGQTPDTADQGSSGSGGSTDPVSQLEGMLSGLLSAEEVSDVEGVAASIQAAQNNISTVEGDISEAESLGSEAKSTVEGVAASIHVAKNNISKVEGDLSKAESLENKATSEVDGAAASLHVAKKNISKVEGDLSEVESLGNKASSATSKIKRLKGAKAKYSKMINLCSNPVDDVTEAENVVSSVGNLAKHPDAVINQAESLINIGSAGISALTSATSPEEALTNLMGVATQLNGSGSVDDDSDDGDANSPGVKSDSNDPDNTFLPSIVSAGNANGGQGDDGSETTPSEFVNAGMYGDE
jgi:hypothetical protein